MSKAKRRFATEPALDNTSRPRTQDVAASGAANTDPAAKILSVGVLALVGVRWLIPAESAVHGDTLWIVQLWFAAALIWVWSCLRSRQFVVRLGLFDAALWTLVAGHVVSTAGVFLQGGEKRAALNMAWEWVGLGTSFFLLRQVVATWVQARRFAAILTVVGVALAGLGI